MRVVLPHNLTREEVRHRFHTRIGDIADMLPGGRVETNWPSEDRMQMNVHAMGQQIGGQVDIEEAQVVLEFGLPAALSFLEPIIEGAIRKQGQALLEPPKS